MDPLAPNYLVDQVAARLRGKRLTTGDIPTVSQWIAEQELKLEGKPLLVAQRPWLRALYDDRAEHIVLRKAAQVGGSVWAILAILQKSALFTDWRGAAYLFPTKGDVSDFSQTRVKPLIDENPALRKMIGEVDKVGVRQMGTGFIYFRGMRSSVSIKSIPVDAIVFDELDEADPNERAMAIERLSSSRYGYVYELSNPTLPAYGIDLAFSGNPDRGQPGSDERQWHIRCRACGEWTCMEEEFPKQLGETDLRVLRPSAEYADWRQHFLHGVPFEDMGWHRACRKCGARIDPDDGEWVARRPSVRSPHGYGLSQLYSPSEKASPAEIAKAYATTRHPQQFYNLKIGIGWAPASDILLMSQVLRWCTEAPLLEASPTACTMGIDVGKVIHVVITRPGSLARTRELVYLGVLKDFEELDVLMRRFNVRLCVIDGAYETRLAVAFAQRHRGKVYLNWYNIHQKNRPRWNADEMKVEENRTESLDASRAPFLLEPTTAFQGETNTPIVLLPRAFPIVEEFARHMAALIKRRTEDEGGNVRYEYVHTAPDHFAHAFNYDHLCWAEDSESITRPGGGLVIGGLGGMAAPAGGITNPQHPQFRAGRRPMRIRRS